MLPNKFIPQASYPSEVVGNNFLKWTIIWNVIQTSISYKFSKYINPKLHQYFTDTLYSYVHILHALFKGLMYRYISGGGKLYGIPRTEMIAALV